MADIKALLGVLFESASASVRVRQAYAKRKRFIGDKFFTYALLLRDGKIYVGNSSNIYSRLLDHTLMTPSSSLWVREHGPVQRVLEITVDAPKDAEAERTMHFMSMFGWENVRGASWCRVRMSSPPTGLSEYVPGRMAHHFLSRDEIDDIMAKVENLATELPESEADASP